MKRKFTLLVVVAAAAVIVADAQSSLDPKIPQLLAGEREYLPVDGELLYNCEDLEGYTFTTNFGATKQILDADSAREFGKLFHLHVKRAGNNAWEPQLLTPLNSIPVNSGDVLLYLFFIRTTDTESPNDFGKADFYIQKATSPWTGIGSMSLSLSTSWRKIYVVAESGASYGTGEMDATFHLGYMEQEVEIGGMLALNLGNVDIDSLPANEVVYDGMDPDAAWRSEAESRIEQYRKSDILVKVSDRDGNVVENSTVSIQMQDHAYGFGNFISDLVLKSTADGNNYRAHMKDMFNVATTPFYMGGNSDNWGWYGSGNAQNDYPAMAEWLQMNEIPAKGHVLVWPGWDWMPSFFEELAGDPDGLRQAIEDHLETLVPIGKDRGLYEWDVVNEPYINHDVMDILGEEVMVEWYEKVRQLDPFPKLILNEYNIIMGSGRSDFQENFERVITFLMTEGAPLGGIGMQCHFDENLPGIPAVLGILDRFAVFGLPIQITEFDVAIRDEEVQSQYLGDFYTAVFSHPATEKIVMWGFYEKVMWKPLGALVRSDWTYKSNYHIYKDLLFNQWWTPEASGETDANGEFGIRGFNGYYDISVEISDTTYILEDLLIKGDTILELQPSSFDPAGIPGSGRPLHEPVNCYPNPFSDQVVLTCSVPSGAEFEFQIYSAHGLLVYSEKGEFSGSGASSDSFDLSHLPPGIYLCVVDTGSLSMPRNSFRVVKE